MSQVITLTDSNFQEEVLSSHVPVLVDFWAEWCTPCKMIAPTVEEIANEYQEKLKVGKLNVDSNQITASQYGIRSIPTLLIFKDGKVADQIIGVVPKAHIKSKLDEVI
ncbi:MAG: thioredoxin [candidate division KSB1 bacterium]|nr:thioredoxin [candidate division KSB1 bacterium]